MLTLSDEELAIQLTPFLFKGFAQPWDCLFVYALADIVNYSVVEGNVKISMAKGPPAKPTEWTLSTGDPRSLEHYLALALRTPARREFVS
jgi:hypothetical protein